MARPRKLTVVLLLILAFGLYVGSYLHLSRRSGASDLWCYLSPEPTDRWRILNSACEVFYGPLNLVDRALGTGTAPAYEPMWSIDPSMYFPVVDLDTTYPEYLLLMAALGHPWFLAAALTQYWLLRRYRPERFSVLRALILSALTIAVCLPVAGLLDTGRLYLHCVFVPAIIASLISMSVMTVLSIITPVAMIRALTRASTRRA